MAADEAEAVVRRRRGATAEESMSTVVEEVEVVSVAAEEPEATAAEKMKAASAATDQAEALASEVPWRQGDRGHVSPPRPSRRRPQ